MENSHQYTHCMRRVHINEYIDKSLQERKSGFSYPSYQKVRKNKYS